jgi:hypothetical protein
MSNQTEKKIIEDFILFHFIMKRFLDKKMKVPPKVIKNLKDAKEKLPKTFNTEELIKLNENNKELLSYVKREFKEYKREYKYIGDTELEDVMCFSLDGEMGNDVVSSFPEFIKQKDKAVCFSYHQKLGQLMWVDPIQFKDEMKRYKNFIRDGRLVVKEYNNQEKKINNVSWYSLVIQNTKEEQNDICIGSLKLFRFMVSGFVYWFSSKTNRDNIYKWLNK